MRGVKKLSTKEVLDLEKEELQERIFSQKKLIEKMSDYHAFVYVEESPEIKGPSIGVKDNICVKGKPVTACSRILEGYVAVYDATAYKKIKNETTFLGKTSCDPFGCGSSGAGSDFGRTKHPFDPKRVPGGSSGGNGTALALGMIDLALGTDTFGSARAPASFCGVVGMRPSYGIVSRHGLLDLSMSLDVVSPMARDVFGVAWVLSKIVGKDDSDLTTTSVKIDLDLLDVDVKKPRIGVLKEEMLKEVDHGILKLLEQKIRIIDVEVTEVDFPLSLEDIVKAYYILMPAEFSSSMQRYSGLLFGKRVGNKWEDFFQLTRSELLSEELKRRIAVGTFVTMKEKKSKYYEKALSVFSKFRTEIERLFKSLELDAIITPTMPVVPWKFGEVQDPTKVYLMDVLTGIASAGGLPAISIPIGEVKSLPVGMQIIGRRFHDARVLRLARMYEEGLK